MHKRYINTKTDLLLLRKGPYVGKIKIVFLIAYSRKHSACQFDTKIRYIAQSLKWLLQMLSFKTCIMKKNKVIE